LPLARPMYLGWPNSGAAYRFDGQYMLGESLLVAPVAKPGRRAAKRVWFPRGEWVDTFTGAVHRGPGPKRLVVPLERMAVFARAGSVVPRQAYTGQSSRGQARELTLDVYPGDDGGFTLYEDAGDGLGYEQGQAARTQLRWNESRSSGTLSIAAAKGAYPGQPKKRSYELRLATEKRPDRVVLHAGKRSRTLKSSFDREARRVVVRVGRLPSGRDASVRFEFAARNVGN
jgi:alpha-glucosidase (family GH31 glycosyl hydrolase)